MGDIGTVITDFVIPLIVGSTSLIVGVLVYKVNKKNALTQAEKQSQDFATQTYDMAERLRNELRSELDRREEKIEKLNDRIAKLTSDLQELHAENKKLQDEAIQIQHKYRAFETNMLHRMEMLENAHFDLPIPQWIKDDSGRILLINRVYEEVFLKPRGYKRSDYKFDHDVWPEDVCRDFKKNDMDVIINNRPWVGTEIVEDSDGNRVKWRIAKYPLRSGIHIIGVIGIAFPEHVDDLFKHLSEEQVDKMEQMKG